MAEIVCNICYGIGSVVINIGTFDLPAYDHCVCPNCDGTGRLNETAEVIEKLKQKAIDEPTTSTGIISNERAWMMMQSFFEDWKKCLVDLSEKKENTKDGKE